MTSKKMGFPSNPLFLLVTGAVDPEPQECSPGELHHNYCALPPMWVEDEGDAVFYNRYYCGYCLQQVYVEMSRRPMSEFDGSKVFMGSDTDGNVH